MKPQAKKPKTPKERLIASLEVKLKNKSRRISTLQANFRAGITKEQDEMELIGIQLEALRKRT